MANIDILFKGANSCALFGWVLLILAPDSRWTQRLLFRPVIPVLLAASYPVLLCCGWEAFRDGGGFGSLTSVSRLFENRLALFAGWVHYLAFDLLVGAWILSDSKQLGIRHCQIMPALALTFLFGPVGWLTYQIERQLLKRKRIDQ